MNLVEHENGDVFADSQNILTRWNNCFCLLLDVHAVNDRQTEIHTTEPLVPEHSYF
jgi:hypothetical protein